MDQQRDNGENTFPAFLWLFEFRDHFTGDVQQVAVDPAAPWELYDLAKRTSIEHAYGVFRFGATVALGGWREEDERRLQGAFFGILDKMARIPLEEQQNMVLATSYSILRSKLMSRTRVAAWASRMLGRSIMPDAWRKAVNAWSDRQGLPRLDLPTGRPRKKKPENIG